MSNPLVNQNQPIGFGVAAAAPQPQNQPAQEQPAQQAPPAQPPAPAQPAGAGGFATGGFAPAQQAPQQSFVAPNQAQQQSFVAPNQAPQAQPSTPTLSVVAAVAPESHGLGTTILPEGVGEYTVNYMNPAKPEFGLLGEAVVIRMEAINVQEGTGTNFDGKERLDGDLLVLSGPYTGKIYDKIGISNTRIVSGAKRLIAQGAKFYAGRVAIGKTSNKGNNPPTQLDILGDVELDHTKAALIQVGWAQPGEL